MAQQVSLAPVNATGALFALKEVAFSPGAPGLKEPFTIKGKVDLFSLPYLAVVWIIAIVTYPQRWWETVGSPKVAVGSMAWLGNFSITFPEGFDREGDYKLDVAAYLGPTMAVGGGPISSVSMAIPPFPPISTVPTQTFTVAGTAESHYAIGKPTVSPSVIYQGTKVTITVPVTSNAPSAETVVVRLKVDHGSILSGPGSTITTFSSPATLMNPGDSKTFTFTYTEVAPNDGRRDTEVDVLVGGVSKGYDHQNDLWTVQTQPGGFTVGQPTASPTIVNPGQIVTITCPVTSHSSAAQAATISIQIYEAGFLWLAGHLIETKIVQANIAANGTHNAVVQHTATSGGSQNSQGQAWRAVGVVVSVGGADVASAQKDNIFGVQVSGSIAFTIGQPQVSPSDHVTLGTALTITIPITSKSAQNQSVNVKVNINEGSALPGPGALIETFNSAFSIALNETKNVVIHTTAQGAADRKDIEVWVQISGEDKAYKHFDDVFWVTTLTQVKFQLGQPNADPYTVLPGGTVRISANLISQATTQQTVKLVFEIKQAGFGGYSGPVIDTKTDERTINPGQSLTYSVLHVATNTGGPQDANGIAMRVVAIGVYVSGQLANVTNQPDNPHEFDNIFGVNTRGIVGAAFSIKAADPPFTVTSQWMLYYYSYRDSFFYSDQQWHGIESPITFDNHGRGYLAAFCMGGWPNYEISPQYSSTDFDPADGATYEFSITSGTIRRLS